MSLAPIHPEGPDVDTTLAPVQPEGLDVPAGGGGGGTPGGSSGELQYNNGGNFGGTSNLIWDGTNLSMNTAQTNFAVTPTGDLFLFGGTAAGAGIRVANNDQLVIGNNALRLAIGPTGDLEINTDPGTAGYVLTSGGPGVAPSWAPASGAPGGSDGQVQYNNGGSFGGTSMVYDDASDGFTTTLTGDWSVTAGVDQLQQVNAGFGGYMHLQLGGANLGVALATSGANVTVGIDYIHFTLASGNNIRFLGPDGDWQINGDSGTAGDVFTSQGAGALPIWAPAGGSGPSEPANQIVFGTGGGIDSDSSFTYDASAGRLLLLGVTNGTGGVFLNASSSPAAGGQGGSIGLLAAGGDFGGDVGLTGGNAINGGNQRGGDVVALAGRGTGAGRDGNFEVQTGLFISRLIISGTGEWNLAGDVGTAGDVLTSQGAGTPPIWAPVSATIAIPAAELVFGTGTGVSSSPSLTYNDVAGGAVEFDARNGGPTGNGGVFTIRGGEGGATSGSGGGLNLFPGNATTDGNGGALQIFGGAGAGSGVAGDVSITAGSGPFLGGNVTITGGAGVVGGAPVMVGGTGSSFGGNAGIFGGAATSGPGGSVSIGGGAASGSDNDGGDISIAGGTATGTGVPGEIVFETDSTSRLTLTGFGEWEVNGDAGTAGQVLMSQGAGVPAQWDSIPGGAFPTPADSAGFEDVLFTTPKSGGDSTGLSNDATVYSAQIAVDGAAPTNIDVTGSDAQTFTDLLSEINIDLAGTLATASLIDGNIRIISGTTGLTSGIVIIDLGLFSQLTDFRNVRGIVPGYVAAGNITYWDGANWITSNLFQFLNLNNAVQIGPSNWYATNADAGTSISINAGSGGNQGASGGNVDITGGTASGTGAGGGGVSLSGGSGSGNGGAGGDADVSQGGSIALQSGPGWNDYSGQILIKVADPTASAGVNVAGNEILIQAGLAVSNTGAATRGGDVRVIPGMAAGAPNEIDGSVRLGITGMDDADRWGNFVYIPSSDGPPTGTPDTVAGTVPITYDTSTDTLYVYNGGWKSVALT